MQTIHTIKEMKSHRTYLRKNMTEAERILWSCIKKKMLNYQFYRQHSFGAYIVDFYCPAKKLVIELDGNHHLEKKEEDLERTRYLSSLGYQVLRFWNDEVKTNLVGVLRTIEDILYR